MKNYFKKFLEKIFTTKRFCTFNNPLPTKGLLRVLIYLLGSKQNKSYKTSFKGSAASFALFPIP